MWDRFEPRDDDRNRGSAWDRSLTDKRIGIYSDDMTSTVGEVIWTQADENIGLWTK